MKKIVFLLAMGLLFAGSVSAQSYYYGPRRAHRRPAPAPRSSNSDFYRVRVGITGGLNIANTVDSYNNDYRTGSIAAWNAGLFIDVPLIYPLSFEPELLYSQKGFTAQTTAGNLTSRTNFIDVPLLAKFHLAPGFNFLIGPQLSFPTSTTNTYNDGFQVTEKDHFNYDNNTTFVDGVVGVSFDLNPSVELRARYTIDLNENDGNGAYTPDYRNQVFQIGLGIKFQ
jgi:hypothetical protein